ncbi:hypothetical protein SRIMM317S_06360 [Streptomyces rimosus subsp. rimosus]
MQKNAPDYFPEWVRRSEQSKEGGTVTHVVCDDPATLVYLADQASVTVHRWLSREHRPDHPDLLIFDLDPAEGADFEDVRWAAHRVCELWDELKLPARLMTTGSRGLDAIAPLDAGSDFDSVRDFAHLAAGLLARRHPDRLTTEQRKAERKGRVYLDVQRNAYAQTAAAPYSVRAKPGRAGGHPDHPRRTGRPGPDGPAVDRGHHPRPPFRIRPVVGAVVARAVGTGRAGAAGGPQGVAAGDRPRRWVRLRA